MITDTIVAISTSLQESAISIIRLSGFDSLKIVNKISSINLFNLSSNTINYAYIIDPLTKEKIDEVLISIFLSPKTYTRENMVEINSHGGVIVTERILELCLISGARLAMPGEFLKRAVINGRINIAQAEGVFSIIKAPNDYARKLAINEISGKTKKIIKPFLKILLNIILKIEVSIDYPEYDDIKTITKKDILPKCYFLFKKIKKILKNSKISIKLKNGIKIAFFGKKNVGKSSLFNAIIKKNRSIVTNIPGTTTDVVEKIIRFKDITVKFFDTAGIGKSKNKIENIGIKKTFKIINKSDFVIIVLDSSKKLDKNDFFILKKIKKKKAIIVYNKNDIKKKKSKKKIFVSAKNNDISELISVIKNKFINHKKILNKQVISNNRHFIILKSVLLKIKKIIFYLENNIEADVLSMDLKEIYDDLNSIFFINKKLDVFDKIFEKFCLGK